MSNKKKFKIQFLPLKTMSFFISNKRNVLNLFFFGKDFFLFQNVFLCQNTGQLDAIMFTLEILSKLFGKKNFHVTNVEFALFFLHLEKKWKSIFFSGKL